MSRSVGLFPRPSASLSGRVACLTIGVHRRRRRRRLGVNDCVARRRRHHYGYRGWRLHGPLFLDGARGKPDAATAADARDSSVNVRDIESGKMRATRELFGGTRLSAGGDPLGALRLSLWAASGVRLLRCRGDVTANIIKRDWRRLGKGW
jgi:hypothetical protein